MSPKILTLAIILLTINQVVISQSSLGFLTDLIKEVKDDDEDDISLTFEEIVLKRG
jgi:hypothetical protein